MSGSITHSNVGYVFRVMMVLGCCLWAFGCSSSHTQPALSIEEQWVAATKDTSWRTAEGAEERRAILDRLLKSAPKKQFEDELAKIRDEHIEYETEQLPTAFALIFAERKDWQSLVRLWSVRCPEYIGEEPLEQFVANLPLENPWELLAKAYTESQDANTRSEMLNAFANAFQSRYPKAGRNKDNVFVADCVAWFAENHSRLSFNGGFEHRRNLLGSIPGYRTDRDYHPEDLYVFSAK